jgi:hypothetical protein
MPESEQPNPAWEWFCHKYEIDSLDMGPEIWRGRAWSQVQRSGGCLLRWGFPFWDKEKLETWGVITSASSGKEGHGKEEANSKGKKC